MRWGYKGDFNSIHNVEHYKDLKQIWYNVNTLNLVVIWTHIIYFLYFSVLKYIIIKMQIFTKEKVQALLPIPD